MPRLRLLAIALMALSGCQSSPPRSTTAHSSGDDGLSLGTAVIINAKNDFDGARAVYAWLREHASGAKVKGQSLVADAGRAYDVMQVVTVDGTERSYFFDISKSFGKW
jgi:hypothetical protein